MDMLEVRIDGCPIWKETTGGILLMEENLAVTTRMTLKNLVGNPCKPVFVPVILWGVNTCEQ